MPGESLGAILKLAAAKEAAAQEFYRKLKEKVRNRSVQQLIDDMIAEEEKHRQVLERTSPDDVLAGTTAPVEDFGISEYLEEPEEKADMSVQEILVVAMKREERSVAMYTLFAEKFSSEKYRSLFLTMANEEKKHKATLEKVYDDKIYQEN